MKNWICSLVSLKEEDEILYQMICKNKDAKSNAWGSWDVSDIRLIGYQMVAMTKSWIEEMPW